MYLYLPIHTIENLILLSNTNTYKNQDLLNLSFCLAVAAEKIKLTNIIIKNKIMYLVHRSFCNEISLNKIWQKKRILK